MCSAIRAALTASSEVVDTICRNVNRTLGITLNIYRVSKLQLFEVPACVPVTQDLNWTFNDLNWTCIKPVTTVFEENRFSRVGLNHLKIKDSFFFFFCGDVWLFSLSGNQWLALASTRNIVVRGEILCLRVSWDHWFFGERRVVFLALFYFSSKLRNSNIAERHQK